MPGSSCQEDSKRVILEESGKGVESILALPPCRLDPAAGQDELSTYLTLRKLGENVDHCTESAWSTYVDGVLHNFVCDTFCAMCQPLPCVILPLLGSVTHYVYPHFSMPVQYWL